MASSNDMVTVTVRELEKGTEYIFSIIARNSAGDGATLTLDPVQTDIDRELVVGRGTGAEGLGERGVGREGGGLYISLHYVHVCTCTLNLCYQKHISFPKGGKGKILVLHAGTKKSINVHYMPWGT